MGIGSVVKFYLADEVRLVKGRASKQPLFGWFEVASTMFRPNQLFYGRQQVPYFKKKLIFYIFTTAIPIKPGPV